MAARSGAGGASAPEPSGRRPRAAPAAAAERRRPVPRLRGRLWFEDGADIEQLAGIGDRSGGFTALWAHDRPAEERLVADLIDRIVSAVQADPAMHVYHYAPYEVTALQKLTGGYGVRETELDQLNAR